MTTLFASNDYGKKDSRGNHKKFLTFVRLSSTLRRLTARIVGDIEENQDIEITLSTLRRMTMGREDSRVTTKSFSPLL